MATTTDQSLLVYVGTYTGPGRAEGIGLLRLDATTGALTGRDTVRGVENPSFLALHPQRPLLFAVEETGSYQGMASGAVSAFAIDPASGGLRFLNRQATHGAAPCYVSVEPSGQYVLVANYTSGNVAVLPIGPDGSLGTATHVVQHEGRGPHPRRQEGPHAHFISPDPAGAFILACDLGIDKVLVYRLDRAAGRLVPNEVPYGQVASGEGPRHLAFHPGGRFVYVLNEIGSSVSTFAYDGERGTLTHRQTLSTLPPGFAGRSSCAQIVVHPSGRWLYASNRGHDSIALFAIDQESGSLAPLGHEPTQGRTPRNFNIDPSGTYLLAANQESHTIVTFRIDQESGRLVPTGHVVQTPAPVCLVFWAAG